MNTAGWSPRGPCSSEAPAPLPPGLPCLPARTLPGRTQPLPAGPVTCPSLGVSPRLSHGEHRGSVAAAEPIGTSVRAGGRSSWGDGHGAAVRRAGRASPATWRRGARAETQAGSHLACHGGAWGLRSAVPRCLLLVFPFTLALCTCCFCASVSVWCAVPVGCVVCAGDGVWGTHAHVCGVCSTWCAWHVCVLALQGAPSSPFWSRRSRPEAVGSESWGLKLGLQSPNPSP